MNNNIKFTIPIVDIVKGQNAKGEKIYKIKGLASTKDEDTQGETLDPNTFDLSSFNQLNWNHLGKSNPGAILGAITKHNIDNKGLMIEGELFPEMEMTKSVVSLMKAYKKRGKQLQLSVEGSVLERGSQDENDPAYKKILKAKLVGCAITPNPINGSTWVDLIEKGESVNEWQYDNEDELLIKAVDEGTYKSEDADSDDNEEESDKDPNEDQEGLEKTMTAENTLMVSKESVEAEVKKPIENETNSNVDKKILSKSQIYEYLFKYFYPVKSEQANSIYSLIQKISSMEDNKITEETIKKAIEILDLAAQTAQVANTTTEEVSEESTENKDLNKSNDVEVVGEKEHANDTIEKALKNISDSIDGSIKHSTTTLGAAAQVIKAVYDQNKELSEDNKILKSQVDELSSKIEKFMAARGFQKSLTTDIQARERFEKSSDGKVEIYNIADRVQKRALINKLFDLSGFNKTNDIEKSDKKIVGFATDLETTGALSQEALNYLVDNNIAVRV